MSDEHYVDDDRLDARLRSGLRALVAEAPEPPPLPAPTIGGSAGPRRMLALAAVVLVLGLVVAAVVAVTRGPEDTNTVTTDSTAPAVTEAAEVADVLGAWRLDAAYDGAGAVDVEADPGTFQFRECRHSEDCDTDFRVYGHDGCQDVHVDADLVDHRLRTGRLEGSASSCADPLSPVVREVLGGASGVSVRDGLLHLRAPGGGELVLRRTFPGQTKARVLVSGTYEGVPYVLKWYEVGSTSDLLASVGPPPGSSVGAPIALDDADAFFSVGAPTLVVGAGLQFGVAPRGAARVVLTTPSGEELEADLHPLRGAGGLQAFSAIAAVSPSSIDAYAAGGERLAHIDMPG